MLYWLIPVILLPISLGAMVLLALRKVPRLTLLNIDSAPEEKMRKTKEKLMLERVERMSQKQFKGMAKRAVSLGVQVSKTGRRLVQKVYALEQYYEKVRHAQEPQTRVMDVKRRETLLEEVHELLREEEYIPAEKKLIEIISHNPKDAEAYEELGNLYLEAKQFEQARETLRFALRLNPEDASVHMSMAELETLEGNKKGALEEVKQAVSKRPQNPKYLDMMIQSALACREVQSAQDALALLKKANPENQKIQEFENRIEELVVALPNAPTF